MASDTVTLPEFVSEADQRAMHHVDEHVDRPGLMSVNHVTATRLIAACVDEVADMGITTDHPRHGIIDMRDMTIEPPRFRVYP